MALAVLTAGLLVAAAVVWGNRATRAQSAVQHRASLAARAREIRAVTAVERRRYRQTVIVTCKSGRAWRGVLFEADRRTVVLRNAEIVDGQSPVVVDGEVLLQRADIEFMQRP